MSDSRKPLAPAMDEAGTDIDLVHPNPWLELRRYTQARIALGRSGNSMPTAPMLEFSLAHAQARDAVHAPLHSDPLHDRLRELGLASLELHSAAADRNAYLKRPDLGRQLAPDSVRTLQAWLAENGEAQCDIALVIADGLSSVATARHALPLIDALLPLLGEQRMGPVVIAREARVALADPIGEMLGAAIVVVLIGERPGLSATDSLGVYLTWHPHIGCSDAERNCISNIRPGGLGYVAAARKLHYLMAEASRIGATGITLKDHSDTDTTRDGTRRIKSADGPHGEKTNP
jgi:ethanolamine ammonia-lyase small subunit